MIYYINIQVIIIWFHTINLHNSKIKTLNSVRNITYNKKKKSNISDIGPLNKLYQHKKKILLF